MCRTEVNWKSYNLIFHVQLFLTKSRPWVAVRRRTQLESTLLPLPPHPPPPQPRHWYTLIAWFWISAQSASWTLRPWVHFARWEVAGLQCVNPSSVLFWWGKKNHPNHQITDLFSFITFLFVHGTGIFFWLTLAQVELSSCFSNKDVHHLLSPSLIFQVFHDKDKNNLKSKSCDYYTKECHSKLHLSNVLIIV